MSGSGDPAGRGIGAGERAAGAFAERFGGEAEFRAAAPGRINLIGEHTDYNGGLVLPTVISRACVALGSRAAGARTCVVAADLGEAFEFEAGGDLSRLLGLPGGAARGSWASYVLGVLDGFRVAGHEVPAMNIAIASDVPMGSGLSSSAALEVAVARLVQRVTGARMDGLAVARLCRGAEHRFAGVPCGIMDQLVVSMGEAGTALLIDCSDESVTRVPLPPADRATILIVDTRVRHRLADGEYGKRRAACASAAAKLGVSMLSEAGIEGLATAGLSEEESLCATHVLLENARVRLAVKALERGDLVALGQLMYESHASLRYDYRVSCAELDAVVDTARGMPGVYGARMTGAGFGGCAIVLVEPGPAAEIRGAIERGFAARFGTECSVLGT